MTNEKLLDDLIEKTKKLGACSSECTHRPVGCTVEVANARRAVLERMRPDEEIIPGPVEVEESKLDLREVKCPKCGSPEKQRVSAVAHNCPRCGQKIYHR